MVQTSTFFKKRAFRIVNLLFLALGQALQFLLLPLQTWGFRRRETGLRGCQRGVAPLQRTLPQGTCSLGWTDPESLDHITPHGEEGPLSPCLLFLHWARCSPGLTCENANPLPRSVPTTAPALARGAAAEGWTQ